MSPTAYALQGFAAALNAEFSAGLAMDGVGPLAVEVNGDRSVSIAASPDGHDLVLCSPLLVLDRPGDVVVLAAALACNLYQEDTAGGAVGLDTDSQWLVLSWRLAADRHDSRDLLVAFNNFCATADQLAKTLANAIADFPVSERERIDRRASYGDPWLPAPQIPRA